MFIKYFLTQIIPTYPLNNTDKIIIYLNYDERLTPNEFLLWSKPNEFSSEELNKMKDYTIDVIRKQKLKRILK